MAAASCVSRRVVSYLSRVSSLAITLFGPGIGFSSWYNRDDVVMGGRSASKALASETELLFYGDVSLENYGGFAHIKCDDLPKEEIETASEAGCDALRVTAVGDGKRYQLYCGGSSLPGGTRQRYPLGVGTKGEEITTVVPLGAMTPTFRGRTIDTAPMTDVGQLTSIALLIADKQKGPFEMHLLSIEAVKLEDTEAKEGTERATTRTGKD